MAKYGLFPVSVFPYFSYTVQIWENMEQEKNSISENFPAVLLAEKLDQSLEKAWIRFIKE